VIQSELYSQTGQDHMNTF